MNESGRIEGTTTFVTDEDDGDDLNKSLAA